MLDDEARMVAVCDQACNAFTPDRLRSGFYLPHFKTRIVGSANQHSMRSPRSSSLLGRADDIVSLSSSLAFGNLNESRRNDASSWAEKIDEFT